MEDPNVIRTETRLRLPIFGQLPDVGHRKLAMCLNLGECQISSAVSTVLRRQRLAESRAARVRSIVDTAICTKPGEVLAGQLL